jgi:amino-acid N-acetyltransferase
MMMEHPGVDPFVTGFRQSTPYIYAHRGRTFVIAFGGEALLDEHFPALIHDIALLHGLGIHLTIVHGARPQIEQRLAWRQTAMRYVNGIRITDAAALACVKDAAGATRVDIEALLSLGLANSPMAGVRIPVASGNFVTARPLGVIDGVDYLQTGAVRRIDRQTLQQRLQSGAVALVPPLGYSPTGEVFNLSAPELACAVATALQADKLIFLIEPPGILDQSGQTVSHVHPDQLIASLSAESMSEDRSQILRAAAAACHGGIRRVHLINRSQDGALLRELFTRDGVGTLVSREPFEALRPAQLTDITGILELLAPLEQAGILTKRSRERLEMDIDSFQVAERDGTIISCAALHVFPAASMAELACVVVHPEYRSHGRGDQMLTYMENLARQRGIKKLFVLTTQTAHWFRERGFEPASLTELPDTRQACYNERRNSQIYIKML